jgi:hypothetical protein
MVLEIERRAIFDSYGGNDSAVLYALVEMRALDFDFPNAPKIKISPDDPKNTMDSIIPRVIHQVWFDLGRSAVMPEKYKQWQSNMLRENPDWQLMMWDRAKSDAFVSEHFPWFAPIYADYADDIYRIDAIRYLLLYHYGGVYVDADLEMIEKLNNIVSYKPGCVILTRSRLWNQSISNYFMASPRSHPLMRMAVHRLAARGTCTVFNVRYSFLGTMQMAGPHFLASVYTEYLKEYGSEAKVWVTGPYCFAEEEPQGAEWHLGRHTFDSGWGSGPKAEGDAARALAVLTAAVAVAVTYKYAGAPWVLVLILALSSIVYLGASAITHGCRCVKPAELRERGI